MKLEYIDIHSHLNFPKLENDIENVLQRMADQKVGTIVVGVNKESSEKAVKIAEKYENVWACVGIHPTDSKESFDKDFFETLAKNQNVVAVGECGLDYFRETTVSDKEKQKELFLSQIDFAIQMDLPLMLHIRASGGTEDAHEESLEILKGKKKKYGEKLRGNVHFFTGSWSVAQKYFALGFTLSITGVVTFSDDLNEVVKKAPLEMLHIETDSPYATPVPHRGKVNEPSFVIEIPKRMAKIRGMEENEIRSKLLENTVKFFHLDAYPHTF